MRRLLEEAERIIDESLTVNVGTADYARDAQKWIAKVRCKLYGDHDFSGGNYSMCPRCGEMIR